MASPPTATTPPPRPPDPDPTRAMRGPRLGIHTPKGSRLVLELLADTQRWAATITPAEVLSQIASPFAADPRPAVSEALDHAA